MSGKDYEMVAGLETHVELKTATKIFCGCSTAFGAEPNTQCCPVCTGMPGSLPVLNRQAVHYAIKAGLAVNCRIASYSKEDRKNYFYPDLPKAYQISQYDLPLCENGYLDIETYIVALFSAKSVLTYGTDIWTLKPEKDASASESPESILRRMPGS